MVFHLSGERTALILAETFGDLDKIMNADEEELKKAEEVGPKVAHAIRQFFDQRANRELVERLRNEGFSFHVHGDAAHGEAGRTHIRADRARFRI